MLPYYYFYNQHAYSYNSYTAKAPNYITCASLTELDAVITSCSFVYYIAHHLHCLKITKFTNFTSVIM